MIVAAGTAQTTSAPRLKQTLPNGATVFVERMPDAKLVSVQLVASSKGCEDTPATHGWRHLLEHVLAKGPHKDLDRRLESEGMFLSAETTRDVMRLGITGRPDQLSKALEAVAELLEPLRTDGEELRREVQVHEREFLLAPPYAGGLAHAWSSRFGSARLDPHGRIEAMRAATPTDLESLWARHFRPENVVLAVAGPVEIDAAMKAARAVAASLRPAWVAEPSSSGAAPAHDAGSPDDVRAVRLEGLQQPSAAHTLAAGMALSARSPGLRFVYTPSARAGLCFLVGEASVGVDAAIGVIAEDEWSGLAAQGRLLATGWLRRLLADPSDAAALRATLFAWDPAARPERTLEHLRTMSAKEFREAAGRFRLAAPEEDGP